MQVNQRLLFLSLALVFALGAFPTEAREKKKREEPVSWVRKMAPPNLDSELIRVVPAYSETLLKLNQLICGLNGHVGRPELVTNLSAAGIQAETLLHRVREFPAQVSGEFYAAKLSGLGIYVKVTSQFIESRWSTTLVELTRRDPRQFNVHLREELLKLTLDDDCVSEDLIKFNYDNEGFLTHVDFRDPSFHAVRPVVEHWKSFDEVYTPAVLKQIGRTRDEIQRIHERGGRVLVTIYDSGVDYNHPKLAYKIPLPPKPMSPTSVARLGSIRAELRTLSEKLLSAQELTSVEQKVEINRLKAQMESLRREAMQLVSGWAFGRDDHLPFDFVYEPRNAFQKFNYHGTHIAGIATQGSDEIAILPLRFAVQGEHNHFEAVKFAYERGSRILNFSVSTQNPDYFDGFDTAMDTFPDMLFVVAAGNNGRDITKNPVWPAEFQRKNMIVVGSVDSDGVLDADSNHSCERVDLLAVGVKVESLAPMQLGGTAVLSGTSQAAPKVSRVAALLKAKYPGLSVAEIKDRLCRTADRLPAGREHQARCGILNETGALQ